jgi:hypothetical protein
MPASALVLIKPCFQTLSCAQAGADSATKAAMAAITPLEEETMRIAKFLPELKSLGASDRAFIPVNVT